MSDKRIFTLINYGLSDQYIASIHADGCRDITRDRNDHAGQLHRVRCYTVKGVLNHWIDPEMQEMGYTHADVKVLPCAN